jgi:hypothetical protein
VNRETTNAVKLLEHAPAEWQRIIEVRYGENDGEWLVIAGRLERIGIIALLLAEYIGARRGSYCGDHKTHRVAAKMVAKRHIAIRRVVGFTFPKSGILQL